MKPPFHRVLEDAISIAYPIFHLRGIPAQEWSELVQVLLLRYVRHDEVRDFDRWASCVAWNLATDYQRLGTSIHRGTNPPEDLPSPHQYEPAQDLLFRELETIMNELIDDLPPKLRTVVRAQLAHDGIRDDPALALELGCARSTVRSYRAEALESLRRSLIRRGLL